MDKIKIDWEYCYGIKSLKHEFSFSEGKHSHLIYAPNGTMKTSFAKTMKYLCKNNEILIWTDKGKTL